MFCNQEDRISATGWSECELKFCYSDESGLGVEPYLIMAGVIVDAQRMHVTKDDWTDLLSILSKVTERTIHEFHTRDFYAGNGPWRGMTGPHRAEVIDAIFKWWAERRHGVTFTAIDKAEHALRLADGALLAGCETPWRTAALHLILSIQKQHQREERNKGHTVLFFDREPKEEAPLTALVAKPPGWTDEYYSRGKKQAQLDQIVDVPFFGDSKEVLLVQVADLIAYVLRRYVEIQEGRIVGQYRGEDDRLSRWVKVIAERCMPAAARWPAKGLTDADRMFQGLAPASLRAIGRDK